MGFQGARNGSPMMPRQVSLSDSYTTDRCCFSSLEEAHKPQLDSDVEFYICFYSNCIFLFFASKSFNLFYFYSDVVFFIYFLIPIVFFIFLVPKLLTKIGDARPTQKHPQNLQ